MNILRHYKNSIFGALTILATISLGACSNSNDSDIDIDPKPSFSELAHLEEGQVLNREFKYGDFTITLEDEMVNFGGPNSPILFPVNKSISVTSPDITGAVFVVTREQIEAFLKLWAKSFSLPFETVEDKVKVAESVYDYFISSEIDFGLFVDLALNGYEVNNLKKIGNQSRAADVDFNSMLYTIWSNKKELTPEKMNTRGTVKDIFGIIEGVVDLYNVWNDFSKNATPIAEAVDGVCSFLNAQDSIPRNYNLSRSFDSGEYKLKYWVSGIWHAIYEYKIEGFTGSHPDFKGKYIPKARVTTTKLDVKGPHFIGQGKYKFSPVVNVGRSADDPIVQVNGMVQVVYGDCCCFRFFSYLNFSLHGEDGYSVVTYDDGR